MLDRIQKVASDLFLISVTGDDTVQIATSLAVFRRMDRELDVCQRNVVLPTPAEDSLELT